MKTPPSQFGLPRDHRRHVLRPQSRDSSIARLWQTESAKRQRLLKRSKQSSSVGTCSSDHKAWCGNANACRSAVATQRLHVGPASSAAVAFLHCGERQMIKQRETTPSLQNSRVERGDSSQSGDVPMHAFLSLLAPRRARRWAAILV